MLIAFAHVETALVASVKACAAVAEQFEPHVRAQVLAELIACIAGAFAALTTHEQDQQLEHLAHVTSASLSQAIVGGEK